MSHAEIAADEALGNRLQDEVSALFCEIIQTPASTLAGLAIKAWLLAYQNDVDRPDEASIAGALRGAHYFEDRATFSLALDVLRLARTAA